MLADFLAWFWMAVSLSLFDITSYEMDGTAMQNVALKKTSPKSATNVTVLALYGSQDEGDLELQLYSLEKFLNHRYEFKIISNDVHKWSRRDNVKFTNNTFETIWQEIADSSGYVMLMKPDVYIISEFDANRFLGVASGARVLVSDDDSLMLFRDAASLKDRSYLCQNSICFHADASDYIDVASARKSIEPRLERYLHEEELRYGAPLSSKLLFESTVFKYSNISASRENSQEYYASKRAYLRYFIMRELQ